MRYCVYTLKLKNSDLCITLGYILRHSKYFKGFKIELNQTKSMTKYQVIIYNKILKHTEYFDNV